MTNEEKILVLSRNLDDVKSELEPYFPLEMIQIFNDLQDIVKTSSANNRGIYLSAAATQACLASPIRITTIFDSLPIAVIVLDLNHKIFWKNKQFEQWCCDFNDNHTEAFRDSIFGSSFYAMLGKTTLLGPDYCPFHTAIGTQRATQTIFRNAKNEYFQMDVVPQLENTQVKKLLVTLQNVTEQQVTEQHLDALMKAGFELANMTPEQLIDLSPEERISYLKSDIIRMTEDILNYKMMEIRLISGDPEELESLLAIGMEEDAINRKLYPLPEKNGITGYVAYTGKSYLCEDTSEDTYYLEGAAGAKSSLTVPLIYHEQVIGTFNVESLEPQAFTEKDMRFLESFARNVAAVINTFELLNAEKAGTTAASVEAIHRAVALPVNTILNDAVWVLSKHQKNIDPESLERLLRIQAKAREVKSVIHKVGAQLSPAQAHPFPPLGKHPLLHDSNVLVVDTDESILLAANEMLNQFGCTVESAPSASDAVLMVQNAHYDAIIADIRLPDCSGYQLFLKLKSVMNMDPIPIILMTGYGYDPGHSIVKARQAGVTSFLYKPFGLDQLLRNLDFVIGRSRRK